MTGSQPGPEERTWRDGLRNELIGLQSSVQGAIADAELKAQVANDALERLLISHLTLAAKTSDERFISLKTASAKTEAAISAAVEGVEARSGMRHLSAVGTLAALEDKLISKVIALRDMVDLRAAMSDTAISKAEEAGARRFDSVNSFRETLADQARHFVTGSVLDAKIQQVANQLDASERAARTASEAMGSLVSSLQSQIAALNGKITVGAFVGIVLVTALQLAFNYLKH